MVDAIRLFGGKDAIREKWQMALIPKIRDLQPEEREELQHALFNGRKNGADLEEIAKGLVPLNKLTTSFVQKFACVFGFSPAEALDEALEENPLDGCEKEVWLKAMRADHAGNVAAAGGAAGQLPSLTLEGYIILCALEELDS